MCVRGVRVGRQMQTGTLGANLTHAHTHCLSMGVCISVFIFSFIRLFVCFRPFCTNERLFRVYFKKEFFKFRPFSTVFEPFGQFSRFKFGFCEASFDRIPKMFEIPFRFSKRK